MRTCWVILLLAPTLSSAAAADAVPNKAEDRSRLVKTYGRLPLSFEENHGQADSRVKFLSRGSGYGLSLTTDGAVLALPNATGSAASLRMRLLGANASANLVGLDELPGKSNYFIGNDPKEWNTGVPTFARVKLSEFTRRGPCLLRLAAVSSTETRIESSGDVLRKGQWRRDSLP